MEQQSNAGQGHSLTAVVIRRDRAGCTVLAGGKSYLCTTPVGAGSNGNAHESRTRSRRFGHPNASGDSLAGGTADAVAVGDVVAFAPFSADRGRIVSVSPRRNRISRRAAGPRPVEQIIAANVDQLVAVFAAAQPAPSWAMLDRYLVIAEAAGAPAMICLTKTDLADEARVGEPLARYESLGYPVRRVCCVDGRGVDALMEDLRGRISLLVGKSGVGKSTLLNALLSRVAASTGAVNSNTGKGRHTTSHTELFPLPDGGGIIDTPGVRELALWDIADAELPAHFPEMRPLLGKCRFTTCTHVHEPGCAIREAVGSGEVAAERYESYRRLLSGEPTGFKHEADAERRPATTPEGFACARCGRAVGTTAPGTEHRNHCPHCLWSVHVDMRPGDRSAACREPMEPIAIWVRSDGEWALVHRCSGCGVVRTNRIAGDDNPAGLVSLAARAIARPPFPLDAWLVRATTE